MAKHKKKRAPKHKAAAKRTQRGRFAPGVSGNPGGRPKDLTAMRMAARAHTQRALAVLVSVMGNRKAAATARVRAADALLDRAWGRPTQELLVDASMVSVDVASAGGDPADMGREGMIRFASRIAYMLAAGGRERERARAREK